MARTSAGNSRVADTMLNELSHVRGITDLRIQQQSDYPKFHIAVDRTKAAQGGFTERDIANSMLVSLSGSFQVTPMFYLNPQNGVSYNLAAQTPQYDIQSRQDLENIPISGPNQKQPAILADVASIQRTSELASINHYNIRRVVDIYASPQDRDLRRGRPYSLPASSMPIVRRLPHWKLRHLARTVRHDEKFLHWLDRWPGLYDRFWSIC